VSDEVSAPDSHACPACGAPLASRLTVPAGEPGDPRTYSLARCEHCGTAVTEGEPPGPESYETGIYAPRPPRAGRAVGRLQHVAVKQPIRLLRKAGVGPGARVLDAGAGAGRLVAELAAAGFDSGGIEPSTRGAERAAAAGQPVLRRSIEEHADAGLDAVVLWHVLEHLDDPRAALERVRSWLRPGGVLLVGVPNVASWQARIAGPCWFHFDAPRHRVHFTPPGLEAALTRAGFEPPRLHHLVWEHNPGAMWMALLSRLGMSAGFPFHLLKRNVNARPRDLALFALGVPLLPLALIAETAAGALGRGGTVAAITRTGANYGAGALQPSCLASARSTES